MYASKCKEDITGYVHSWDMVRAVNIGCTISA